MGAVRFGPSFVPSRESAEEAIAWLRGRGYEACEIDFEGGFWMDWDYAERLGELAAEAGVILSVHAPIPAFLGHRERGKKLRMAVGMLDHTAGIAVACRAELVVMHPGFLLGRERAEAIAAVVDQLGELRSRLEAKGRAVPFGLEVMGRVRELGTLEDVMAVARELEWVRPVLDFAHLHAVSDGGFTGVAPFAEALAAADAAMPGPAPFHLHFSDVSFANRNEKSHLSYGQGTLRAGPLADALRGFGRPATVIGESPDEASNRAIQAVLAGERPDPAAAPQT